MPWTPSSFTSFASCLALGSLHFPAFLFDGASAAAKVGGCSNLLYWTTTGTDDVLEIIILWILDVILLLMLAVLVIIGIILVV